MTTELKTAVRTSLFIAGEWRASSTQSTFDIVNPASGSVIAQVADASPADGIAALDAAVAAADTWAATPPRVRSEILARTFQLLNERKDEFAQLMTAEMGKPLAESYGEIAYGGEFLRWFAEEAVRITGRHGQNPEGTGDIVVTQAPVGPCFLITPWNFPLAMATRKLAPALAAGCTVVIKPASATPLTTLMLVSLMEEAGLPPGVVNVVPTSGARALSNPIIADLRLRKLSFTGSTDVGRNLLRSAASRVLRTSMELGGNAPFIVFEDADIPAAIAGALKAKFRNIGQACTAANRFLIHEDVADEFIRGLLEAIDWMVVGPGNASGTTIGPLIDQGAVDSVSSLVTDARGDGAKLLRGGRPLPGPGSYFEPTLLDNVAETSRIVREEIFGPVVAVQRFSTESEAVERANSSEYGLAAYAYTRDLARIQRLMKLLDTGMLGINTGLISNAAAPFGGVKQSGLGREGGNEGINEYLDTRYTLLPY